MTTTPFFVLPDGRTPRVETIEHYTKIRTGLNGYETRKALRAFPRLRYSANFIALNEVEAAKLVPLFTAGSVVQVPLAHHRLESADGSAPVPDAIYAPGAYGHFLIGSPSGVRATEGLVSSGVPGWQAGDLWAIPLVEARAYISSDTVSADALSHAIRQCQVEFECEPLDEVLPAYEPSYNEYPLLQLRHNWTEAPRENYQHTLLTFDEGNVVSHKPKYVKRSVSISVMLRGREEIALFRSFIYTVQGAARSFVYQGPTDPVPQIYRLADDATQISYLKPNLATCQLNLVEVPQ
jgi:hypothetical protein